MGQNRDFLKNLFFSENQTINLQNSSKKLGLVLFGGLFLQKFAKIWIIPMLGPYKFFTKNRVRELFLAKMGKNKVVLDSFPFL